MGVPCPRQDNEKEWFVIREQREAGRLAHNMMWTETGLLALAVQQERIYLLMFESVETPG